MKSKKKEETTQEDLDKTEMRKPIKISLEIRMKKRSRKMSPSLKETIIKIIRISIRINKDLTKLKLLKRLNNINNI